VRLPTVEMPQSPKRAKSRSRIKERINISRENRDKLAKFARKIQQKPQAQTTWNINMEISDNQVQPKVNSKSQLEP
jgi:predicted nucleic acid-binding OB-fold protein